MNKEQDALEREHHELLLLRDWRDVRRALDLLKGYHDKGVIAKVKRLGYRAERAVARFYATGKCERVDLSAIRVDAPPNKALSNEEQQIVIKAMQDALDPPRPTQPQPESPPMNLRAWRCEGDGVTDRNPGYLLWDGLRMWWKTDGRGWVKASRSKTPAEAAKDHGLVEETDAMMIMALSESRCPTCEVGEYMGRYCIDCGRDTRLI